MTKIEHWHAQQIASALARIKAIPEGNGSMLDNTLIVWMNSIGLHRGGIGEHGHNYLSVSTFGKLGGYVPTGRLLKYNNQSHASLFVSIANGMGLNINQFGANTGVTGPLPGFRS